MDLPILKYLDVAIGLAIVILLLCTIVTAVTQILLSFTYSRARYLRDGLEDLIRQLDPATLDKYALYIAERCLRHPLVARNNTIFGLVTSKLRDAVRKYRGGSAHLLPGLNPPDVIQRDELILMLLEWAGGEGSLSLQDEDLKSRSTPARAEELAQIRDVVKAALLKCGVADPSLAAKDIRAKIVELENANPTQAAALSRSLAIATAAPSDFVGKIHVWFDNTMARVGDQYGLLAQVWATILAFVVVFGCQFDAVDLIKRLATDDKLRADLVQQAKDQSARIEDAQKKADAQKAAPSAAQQKEIDDASAQRQQISESLAVLRDPNRSVLPSYFAWQKVAQTEVCFNPPAGVPGVIQGSINVDADYRAFHFDWNPDSPRENLATALRASGAPVAVYIDRQKDSQCLYLVARDRNAGSIVVRTAIVNLLTSTKLDPAIDRLGLRTRLTGMVLGWILVSLGAPFWFDLLKKLMGLRSLLAKKDDTDRAQRQDQQATPKAGAKSGGASSGGLGPAGGADERGDLTATGGAG